MNSGPLSTRSLRFFCVAAGRQVVATPDHLGQIVCPACTERVEPVVTRQRAL